MLRASYIAGCVCAAVAGAFLATQSGINSTLGARTGRSFAAVVSFAVGLVALIIFWLVDVYALGNKGPTRVGVAEVPWWGWIGGFLGAWYVASVIIFAPVLGAAALMAIFVTAQLSTAVLLDAMGWVGFRQRPLHWARLLGLALMVSGVALVTYFDGTRAMRPAASQPQDGSATALLRPPPLGSYSSNSTGSGKGMGNGMSNGNGTASPGYGFGALEGKGGATGGGEGEGEGGADDRGVAPLLAGNETSSGAAAPVLAVYIDRPP